MKKLNILALCLLFAGGGISGAKAQDIITMKDAEEIPAKVTEISDKNIFYRKWDNIEGPVYSISKADVLFIRYQNGTKEIFREKTSDRDSAAQITGSSSAAKFQGDICVGTIFDAIGAGPTLDIALGARVGRHFFIGAQTGFRSIIEKFGYTIGYDYYESTIFGGYIPLELNMKGYIPVSGNVRPYINCSLGGFFGVADIGGINGFSCQAGAGVEINRISVGIGYNGLVYQGTGSSGYIKIGFRFGKN